MIKLHLSTDGFCFTCKFDPVVFIWISYYCTASSGYQKCNVYYDLLRLKPDNSVCLFCLCIIHIFVCDTYSVYLYVIYNISVCTLLSSLRNFGTIQNHLLFYAIAGHIIHIALGMYTALVTLFHSTLLGKSIVFVLRHIPFCKVCISSSIPSLMFGVYLITPSLGHFISKFTDNFTYINCIDKSWSHNNSYFCLLPSRLCLELQKHIIAKCACYRTNIRLT